MKILKFIFYAICVTVGIVILFNLWALIPDLLFWRFSDWMPDNTNVHADTVLTRKGQFGDSFGGVNALLSGLALIGVTVAIILQRHELKNQKEEMEEQRKTMQKETFERTFFQLLNILEKKYDYIAVGREVLGLHPLSPPEIFLWIHNQEEENLTTYGSYIIAVKTYFLLLIRVLEVIKRSSFCEEEGQKKEAYIHLLRDKMSEPELHALFLLSMEVDFCGESPKIEVEQLRNIIVEYILFRNISKSTLIYFRDEVIKYDYKAHKWPSVDAFGEDHPERDAIIDLLYSDLEAT